MPALLCPGPVSAFISYARLAQSHVITCPHCNVDNALVSQSATILPTYPNKVLTAFSRDNVMTRDNFMLLIVDLSCLGQVLPYPLVLFCHTPPWLRFSCHSLPCSFVPLPCHAFGLPLSASTLATALCTIAQVRSILPWLCISRILHVLLWPFLSSAEQTCHGISMTSRGSLCPWVTLVLL